jgi:membrane protein YdbS with pleckstrin-like domain
MGYWIHLSGVYGGEKMGRTRGTGTQRYRLFMWIATALWLIAAIAAVIDRDTLNAVAWFSFVAAGALTASGVTAALGGWPTCPSDFWSLPWRS